MDEIIAFIRQFEPLARAIVSAAEKADEIESLEECYENLKAEYAECAEEFAMAEKSAAQARASAEQSKTEVINASARIAQMSEAASVRAQKVLADAEAAALAEARRISDEFRTEHENLKARAQDARAALEALEAEIVARRADHDAVMASLASLKSRLGAA